MDYLLENLGPERFQEICQALLAKAFPKTQCFPVAQPDGGRDAVSLFYDDERDGFLVFQVKYVRKPLSEARPHEWLKDVLRDEVPKLTSLIPKGAREYYLLTNVPGTAHPDVGSIDVVQNELATHLSIPAQCWWRNDINRRLDDSWDIKWAYPEILSGPDILRQIFEAGLKEDSQRRTSAVRAYLRDQYERETEVKFKQVELQNRLLDLFIDVPIALRESSSVRRSRNFDGPLLFRLSEAGHARTADEQHGIGAASLLLDGSAQSHFDRVVVEGAPGQGKSTIVQYVCQIHRLRILTEGINDERIPETHRHNPVRLPLKTDCRDFSLWLGKKNPFSADDAANVPQDWQKSLESFLAAQIQHFSGGVPFSVSDLHAVLRISATLLVFDGLDEVADIGRRRDVVEQISKGVTRLREVAVSVQAIVTSRPAAFANSPGLPEDTFRYFSLASIHRTLIEQYAEKWLRARKLDSKESADVRRILRDKLDQPHLRELARNPMQLAILLSLIQTRGGSLPDKRTALYDSYVELFFNRESEKSHVVRDYRDLLIDIHGYLAWTLHSESQTKRDRGSVQSERLKLLVRDYLIAEGHDSTLADVLFTGMIERVVALVSRVEGTYEFEVQPLREYFAARHLYDTAPYSPTGNPKRGTLPDRFDALSRDFYWLNVTRFYAGCYSKGELPSLVDRLEELARTPGYKSTSHPQSLAATLLGDWVFAQHPKSMKQVVALVLDGIGLRHLASSERMYRRDEPLVLPKLSGNEELVDRCFQLLEAQPAYDFSEMLIDVVQANATRSTIHARWLSSAEVMVGARKTRWIEYGLRLGVISSLDPHTLTLLLDEPLENPKRLMTLLRAGQRRFVESDKGRLETVVTHILDEASDLVPRRNADGIDAFQLALNPHRYALVFTNRHPVPLSHVWAHMFSRAQETPEIRDAGLIESQCEIANRCHRFIQLSIREAARHSREWATTLAPWNELIECGRAQFGERWAFCVIANISAGVRSKLETCDEASHLYDQSTALCSRARYARLRAGVPSWWEAQFKSASSEEQVTLALLILFTWAGTSVLSKLSELVNERTEALSPAAWNRLYEGLQPKGHGFGSDKREMEMPAVPQGASPRLIVALCSRLDEHDSNALFRARLENYSGADPLVGEFCVRAAVRAALANPGSWQRWLPVISKNYVGEVKLERHFGHRLARAIRPSGMPRATAEAIIENCDSFPTDLVALAEQTCRASVAEQLTPVGTVAEKQKWFS